VRPTPDTTDNPANYNIGLRKNPSSTTVWDTGVYTASAAGPVHFAVSSYTFNSASATDDTVSLYLNPHPSTFGGAVPASGTILSTAAGGDVGSGQIASFLLRQANQGTAPQGIALDELRIGTTWADVTPPQAFSGSSPPGPMNGGPVATASLADFQPFSYTAPGGAVMPYRLFVPPNYDPQREYPLTVFLHGAGETGTNNVGPASHVSAHRLAARAKDDEYASLVLVPQTHSGFGNYWSPSALSAVMDIIALLEDQYSIDVDREYLTGLSLGGYGTWDMLSQYPDKFAAAVPVAGGGYPGYAELFKHVPIWAYHSLEDAVVPASESQEMIEALRAAGANPLYTEYPFGTHGVSFNDAYSEPQLYEWLFAQSRAAHIPEPATVTMLFLGMTFIGSRRRLACSSKR
jgi:dipeptidyl aminopeptidase/acylaminoacyl peptidase